MRILAMLLLTAGLAACSQEPQEQGEASDAPAEPAVSVYATAVANEARPEADRARDTGRKPAEVLEFIGIQPGMTVLDMYSGGGYYTEILAALVGPEGRVLAQTNEAYLRFVGEEFHDRYANDRLPNASILMAENNELSLDAGSLDAIMLVLSYHDFVIDDPENGWPKIDVTALLAEFHKGLRPGGIVGVIDHYAKAGSPADSGESVHRIDPAIVVAGMNAAGFVLEAQSDLLRNPDDDLEKTVFDPAIRGRTDRFLMRFRKPE